MRNSPRLLLGFLIVWFTPLCAAQNHPLEEIASKLQQVHIESDDMPYEVPELARPLIPVWKSGIRQAIVNVLSDPKSVHSSASQLEEAARKALGEKGVSLPGDAEAYYGQLVELKLQSVKGIPSLLAVTAAINLACGRDTSLYVFQKRQRAWNLVLSSSAGAYAGINGGRESLGYRFSPFGDSSSWYVLLAYSSPWCTSCWGGLHYEVLRPSTDPDKPTVLYSAHRGLYRCGEPPYKLNATRFEFSIAYLDGMARDLDLFWKVSVDRFYLAKDRIKRLPPRRQTAADFVDEWIETPDEEASALVTPSVRQQALEWHEKLSAWTSGESGERVLSRYDWEQSCAKDGTRWQVKLSLKSGYKRSEPEMPQALYFVYSVTADGIVLQSIGTEEDLSCKGERARPERTDINELELP